MNKYWLKLADYAAETTAYSEATGSAFTPKTNGRLVGLRATINGDAASSLIREVQWKLTCPTFVPNSMECGAQGMGLQTVTTSQPEALDWQVDQPVSAGNPITIEARNVTADTPVGVRSSLWGCFVT